MSNIKEIKKAMKLLKKNDVTLLHCVSAYPTKIEEINYWFFEEIKKKLIKILGL